MAAGITRASTMRLPIDDAWLNTFSSDSGVHYWDFFEIRGYAGGQSCVYFNDMISRGWYTQEQCQAMSGYAASMVVNGIHVGNMDDGNDIRGYLTDEPVDAFFLEYERVGTGTGATRQRRSFELVDQIEHPLSYKRIYARGTTIRNIVILGVPTQ
jgi:hypothetical protein